MFSDTQFRVTATLTFDEKGDPVVEASVAGTVLYGERPATVQQSVTDEAALAAIGKSLAKALSDDVSAAVHKAAFASAAKSFAVATENGEEV